MVCLLAGGVREASSVREVLVWAGGEENRLSALWPLVPEAFRTEPFLCKALLSEALPGGEALCGEAFCGEVLCGGGPCGEEAIGAFLWPKGEACDLAKV